MSADLLVITAELEGMREKQLFVSIFWIGFENVTEVLIFSHIELQPKGFYRSPPFGKELPTRLTIFSLCIFTICNFKLRLHYNELAQRTATVWRYLTFGDIRCYTLKKSDECDH